MYKSIIWSSYYFSLVYVNLKAVKLINKLCLTNVKPLKKLFVSNGLVCMITSFSYLTFIKVIPNI
jgi:hypothetical protein